MIYNSTMIDNKKSIVVLDANAFISMVNIVDLGGKNRLITIKNVVDELKDEKSKGYFQRIPFEVEQLNFDDKSMLVVKEFARKTGDLTSLSDTDLQLLALTHTLYSRYMPEVVLRQNPPPMMENNEMDDSDTSGDNSESDEQG